MLSMEDLSILPGLYRCRYWGAGPSRHMTEVAALNSILLSTGSQCSSFNKGFALSNFLFLYTSVAALSGRPESRVTVVEFENIER